ncbi:hypothetical protein BBP40_002239 [Aspergillus hancockii]|nr:hypothetical protein BBP40_002239 [Aspergillus hancockii]
MIPIKRSSTVRAAIPMTKNTTSSDTNAEVERVTNIQPSKLEEPLEGMSEILGQEKAEFFFDHLAHYFFTEADAEFFASLGGLSRALFWEFEVFQEQIINLWTVIGAHYVNNPAVAGYNPLNEPADPQHTHLLNWYDRVEKAIRSVDPDHILFVDGNTYSMDFTHFDRILQNTVYSCHDYAMLGLPIPG